MRALIRKVSDTWIGDRIKAALGVRAPKHLRPRHADSTVSDLFPWRIGGGWQTRFDLMNIPSLTTPEHPAVEPATIVLLDADGHECHRHTELLDPFKVTRLDIGAILKAAGVHDPDGAETLGSFAVFHGIGGAEDHMRTRGSYLTERGYVAYRRTGDPLWSYVHGNTYALAKRADDDAITSMTAHTRGRFVYRPQLLLDDAPGFALVYVNPLPRPTTLSIHLMDRNRTTLHTLERDVPGHGLTTIASDDLPAGTTRVALVEAEGGAQDWRPVVFKFYDNHFDVMHS